MHAPLAGTEVTGLWLRAGVWALLLEATHPSLATEVFYVAGDRVVADPLCKPFSMGRNLFCVHSRKHLDDIPELKEAKQRTNRKTLTEMSRALNQVLPPRPPPRPWGWGWSRAWRPVCCCNQTFTLCWSCVSAWLNSE